MFLVDTNILVYAAVRNSQFHETAHAQVEQWMNGDEGWMATWSIFYEFAGVVSHRGVYAQPLRPAQAWSFLRRIAASPSFRLLVESERHVEIVEELAARFPDVAGSHLHDFHIAALMYEHGVSEIRTADADFHRYKFLRVVNPVA